jgi:hypothetical protein
MKALLSKGEAPALRLHAAALQPLSSQASLLARLNIEHLAGRFPELQHPSERAYVKDLLLRQANQLALAERVEIISRIITETDEAIRKQEYVMSVLADGPIAERANAQLENLRELRVFMAAARWLTDPARTVLPFSRIAGGWPIPVRACASPSHRVASYAC